MRKSKQWQQWQQQVQVQFLALTNAECDVLLGCLDNAMTDRRAVIAEYSSSRAMEREMALDDQIVDCRRLIEKIEAQHQAAPPAKQRSWWRAETGFTPPGSAADVIRYEQESLGNDNHLDPAFLPILAKIPACRLVWACKRQRDARRYGTPVGFRSDGPIIGEDGEGGYLVLLAE